MVAHDDSKQDFSQYIWTGTVHCVLEISTIAISTIASGWHTRCGGARLTLAPSHQGCEARVPRASLAPSHPRTLAPGVRGKSSPSEPRTLAPPAARVRGCEAHPRTLAPGVRGKSSPGEPILQGAPSGFHMEIPDQFPIDLERTPLKASIW